MKSKTPIPTIILLALSLLMFSPAAYVPRAHAASANFQTQETNWTPVGPRMENLLITDYADFNTMFQNFNTGQMDITDWPLDPSHLNTFSTNPDMYITAQQDEFGIFELDINHRLPLFGIAQQTPRAIIAATFTTTTSSAACSVGFGTINVQLFNREGGFDPQTGASIALNSLVKDKFNRVTLQEFPLGAPVQGPVTDSSASGTYSFPCIAAEPGYSILSTEYNTTTNTATTSGSSTTHLATVALGSQQSITVQLTVSYNSPSTVQKTLNGIYARRALDHMLDKPDFVTNDPNCGALCRADDIEGPCGWGLSGSPAVGVCPTGNGKAFNQAFLESVECPALSGALGTPAGFSAVPGACTAANYISAYHIGPAVNIGKTLWWNTRATGVSGYANPNDIMAACDYLVLAGLVLTPSGSTCAQVASESSGATPPSTYVHFVPPAGANSVVTMYIRTSIVRNHYGQLIADTINFFFGTANNACVNNGGAPFSAVNYGINQNPGICNVGVSINSAYYVIRQVVPIVFEDQNTHPWNLYTGGFSLGSLPDFLWANFHSQFASTTCGGPFNSFPANFDYHCDPEYDAYSNAAEFSPTIPGAQPIFNQTAALFYLDQATDGVYNSIDQFAELNCLTWQPGPQASVVRTNGHGSETAFWTLYNMQPNPYYTPVNPSTYSCGGGLQNTIRRGFSQATDNMNPFEALTVWDFEIISQVFDTLLAVNPTTAGATQEVFDWMTQSHTDTSNSAEITCIGNPTFVPASCAANTLQQKWVLRHDVFFHDGTQVNANDVCYSIIAARDTVSALLYSAAFNVASCVPQVGTGTAANPDTAIVKLQIGGAFSDLYIGGLPMIPAHGPHTWAGTGTCTYPNTDCLTTTGLGNCGGALTQTTITGPDGQPHAYTFIPNGDISNCADPTWDPMAAGQMVGSGPWACNNLTTKASGGPCTSTNNAVIDSGDTALLVANENYMRGPTFLQGSKLQAGLWADKFSVGQVNILDIADAALHFGGSDPYWANPLYTCGGGSTVDICAVGTAAGLFGESTLLAGFSPSASPQIDMSGLAFSIGGSNDAAVQSGSNTCAAYVCISAQQIPTGSTVQLRVAYTGSSTKTAQLVNVKVSIEGGSTTSVANGPVMSAGNSYLINTGVSYPAGTEISISFNILYNGVTIGASGSCPSTGGAVCVVGTQYTIGT